MTDMIFVFRNFYALCICALLVTSLGCSPDENANAKSSGTDKLFTVRKGDLVIGTMLTGSVNAKKKHKLALEAGIKTDLNWIVEQNTMVSAGDVVIKFDKDELIEKVDNLRIDVDSSEKELLIEREKKRILASENKASIRKSTDAVTVAEDAYSRFWKYDGKKAKDDKQLAIANAEKSYNDAKKNYLEKSDDISSKMYDDEETKEADEDALEGLKQKMETAENSYNNSILGLKIFKRYTHPNKLSTLTNSLEQAKLNLEKVKISTASSMVQKDNHINRLEKQYKKRKKDLKRYESYIPQMEIKAPVDGIFVYGDMDRRRHKIEIKIGMEVKRKRVLATIPEMNNLIVDFELPEQFRHRVNEGARVLISPESIPTLTIEGKVDEIAMVPVNQIHWDASSPKIYKSKISLDKQNDQLVSGMNVRAEITTDVIKDAVNIPVEAVFEEDGEYFVYKKSMLKSKKQVVELGKSSEDYVHVIKGLNEGDVVYLYRPFEQKSSD